MTQLTIRLLGAPGIARDGAPVAVDTRKATAVSYTHLTLPTIYPV